MNKLSLGYILNLVLATTLAALARGGRNEIRDYGNTRANLCLGECLEVVMDAHGNKLCSAA